MSPRSKRDHNYAVGRQIFDEILSEYKIKLLEITTMYLHAEWMRKTIKESNGSIQKIAEIGVYRGYLCKRMVKYCSNFISEYWAIDPWVQMASHYNWPTKGKNKLRLWEPRYLSMCKLMRSFPKLHVIRTTSLKAAKLFPEQYFDLVFLDGDHFYEAIIKDIPAWLPLVKQGGLLIGHDYANIEGKTGVKKAVDEIFGNQVEIVYHTGKESGLGVIWVYRR